MSPICVPTSSIALDTCSWDEQGRTHTTLIAKLSWSIEKAGVVMGPAPSLDAEMGDYAPYKPCGEVLLVGLDAVPVDSARVIGLGVARGAELLVEKRVIRHVDGTCEGLVGDAQLGPSSTAEGYLVGAIDLRCAYFGGGERLRLVGLRGDRETHDFQLPALVPRGIVETPSGRQLLPMLGDTLVVDLSEMCVTTTWRGLLPQGTTKVSAVLVPLVAVEEILATPPQWRSRRQRVRRAGDPPPLHNRTLFPAHAFTWSRTANENSLTVVVKGTFGLVAEAPAERADEQRPLTSAGALTDFAPYKPVADVVVEATAHRPKEHDVAAVTLSFGAIEKTVVAIGERHWEPNGALSKPARFDALRIAYASAFGGPNHPENPLGTGLHGTPPPRLELRGALIRTQNDRPAPACFSAIPVTWSPRAAAQGSFGDDYAAAVWPALPSGAREAHNCAPTDQRCAYPDASMPFRITSVLPGGGAVSGRLPGVVITCYVERDEGVEPVAMNIDTVLLEVDEHRLSLTWRGVLDVLGDDASDVRSVLVVEGETDPEVAAAIMGEAPPQPWREPTTAPALCAAPMWQARLRATPLGRHAVAQSVGTVPEGPPPPSRDELREWLAADDLAGRDLTGGDLRELDLRGKNLGGTVLNAARMDGCCADGAHLVGAQLGGVRGERTSWRGANLSDADFSHAVLSGADLTDAVVTRATFSSALLDGAVFRRATGERTQLDGAHLHGACLDEARLHHVDMSGAALGEATLVGAALHHAKLYEASGSGVVMDDANLEDACLEEVRFASLRASRICADGSIWDMAVVDEALFSGARLDRASFVGARLASATLDGATCISARFAHAHLRAASATRANFMRASLEAADLEHVNFSASNLYQAELRNTVLEGVQAQGAIVAGSKLDTGGRASG